MVDTVKLGKLLFLERMSRSYTQSYVADVTTISERSLRYIESGNAEPHLDTYWTLCDLYEIPPEMGYAFYRRSPEMENNLAVLKPDLSPVE
jgi:Helix-turn-helix.